jgi:hypothetical protein
MKIKLEIELYETIFIQLSILSYLQIHISGFTKACLTSRLKSFFYEFLLWIFMLLFLI